MRGKFFPVHRDLFEDSGMTRVLVLRSSASGAAPVSNRLIDGYLDALRAAEPGAAITAADLAADPVP